MPDASIVALRLQTPLGAGDHSASAISEGKPAKHAAIVRRRSVKRIRAASRGFVKRTSRRGQQAFALLIARNTCALDAAAATPHEPPQAPLLIARNNTAAPHKPSTARRP